MFIHFLMPHSGTHFLSFWCDLGPKRSILGAPWRPAGAQIAPKICQRAPKIAQVAPKWLPKTLMVPPFAVTQKCWCDLVPKRSILGAPWRPAGPKMAPKITQVVPKSHPSASKKGPESIIPRIVLHYWKRTMMNEKNDKKTPAQNHSFCALKAFHWNTLKSIPLEYA